MYIKNIHIRNYGPIVNVDITPRHTPNGNPVPLLLIGRNGSGKSIILSHIVNVLLSAKQRAYTDCEIEAGKVFKYRSPLYIRSGCHFFYSKIEFSGGPSVSELQLAGKKADIERMGDFITPGPEWNSLPADDTSAFISDFNKTSSEQLFANNCILYFPPNRHEEPGWLNSENLIRPVEYTTRKPLVGHSNRRVLCDSIMSDLRKWLLDLLLDRNVLETSYTTVMGSSFNPFGSTVFLGYHGAASTIYNELIRLLGIVFSEKDGLRFGIGARESRQISINKNDQVWVPNLFQLSSGESLVLGMFMAIIRDYDFCNKGFSGLDSITGIVVIDEIEAHLHANLQKDVLPKLLKLFPKVQFIIATHSPLFVLGMQREFGDSNCDIINMPEGSPASVEGWSEFADVFDAICKTQALQNLVKSTIDKSQLPIVFVEGEYDIRYITKALSLRGQLDLLSKFHFEQGDGYGNLDKIWNSMGSKVACVLTRKTLLLYDCDTKKLDSENGKAVKRIIPTQDDSPIRIGIENLFPRSTVDRLKLANKQFIDIVPEHNEVRRGETISVPSVMSINKDEKKNICDWLCLNGTRDDFARFDAVLAIIRSFIDQA